MLSVDEALALIVERARSLEPTTVPLAEALGLVLAEDVISDLDSPPFDKALMDGYAVRADDVADGTKPLDVVEELSAGRVANQSVESGQAIRIMTGAPLPCGADAVVPFEQTDHGADSGSVRVRSGGLQAGANVMRRATSMAAGDRVLESGRFLRPQELGALAELGRPSLQARPRAEVAVLATGDELVRIEETPGPGRIRNSNETMLVAQVCRAGAVPRPLGIARDQPRDLRERITTGLQCDILLLSGGVSAGKRDIVPAQLAAAGIEQVFHKVNLKPGKPVWFGRHPAGPLVFGLPGNPVSSMVCFELFVRTAIRCLMGMQSALPRTVAARLTREHIARGDRPTYHPSRLESAESGPAVTPVLWQGSADLRATIEANAMALFPAGQGTYAAGGMIDVIAWDDGLWFGNETGM